MRLQRCEQCIDNGCATELHERIGEHHGGSHKFGRWENRAVRKWARRRCRHRSWMVIGVDSRWTHELLHWVKVYRPTEARLRRKCWIKPAERRRQRLLSRRRSPERFCRLRAGTLSAAAARLVQASGNGGCGGVFVSFGMRVVGFAMRLEIAEERELFGAEIAAERLLACERETIRGFWDCCYIKWDRVWGERKFSRAAEDRGRHAGSSVQYSSVKFCTSSALRVLQIMYRAE